MTLIPKFCAYVINLDRDPLRWKHMEESFKRTSLQLVRIAAIDGNTLDLHSLEFDPTRFRIFHGRLVNVYEVACFLSHIKAIQAFLRTNQEHALFCEDDIMIHPKLENVIVAALKEKKSWNILRLTGLCKSHPLVLKKLCAGYDLSIELGRLKGAGAYILDRQAARVFANHLLPMWLPWDHAFDREWFFGLKALVVTPFPISQTREYFSSNIQQNSQPKCSHLQRYLSTYPYQMFNELTRYIFRTSAFMAWKVSRIVALLHPKR